MHMVDMKFLLPFVKFVVMPVCAASLQLQIQLVAYNRSDMRMDHAITLYIVISD